MRNTIITCLAVCFAVLVQWWLLGLMGNLAPFSTFYIAMAVGAWLGGFRQAMLAFVLSITVYAMFFAGPLYKEGTGDTAIAFSIYTVVGLSIAFFGEFLHREKRRALEQAAQLRLSEERSARAQSAAHIAVWECDLIKDTCFFSPEYRAIHGIGQEPFTVEEAFGLIHPDEQEEQLKRFQRALEQQQEQWSSTHRFIHPELGARWCDERARIEYDGTGRPLRMSGTTMDITDQKVKAERSSRAQEVAQAGTWEFDLVAQKAYLSPEYCRLVRMEPKPWFTLEEAMGILHHEDVERVRAHLAATIANGGGMFITENRHVLPNGEVRWRSSRGEIRYGSDGQPLTLMGGTIDVTDRKAAEQALKKSEERFRLATEAVNGMIYDQDLETDVVQRSDGLYELLGVHAADAPPSDEWWISRVHPDDMLEVPPFMEQIFEEQRPLFDMEYRVKHADGHWVWVNDMGRMSYDENGNVIRIVGCTTDITVRKKAEVELQNSDRRKDEFIATLAHELRNPLSPLQHAIDLLDDVATDRQLLTDLRAMMERQMRHLIRLVDDLLDLGRISQGKIELRLNRIDLAGCIHTAIEANRQMLERMDHRLEVMLPATPCMINGDRERMTQVVSNLLNNAIKFTPNGGNISIAVRKEDHDLIMEVKDDGQGMDPDSLERVFDMFVQNGQSVHGGLGIGLNLVRRLIVMHGGTVTARSEGHGKGACFKIRMPVSEAREDIAAQPVSGLQKETEAG